MTGVTPAQDRLAVLVVRAWTEAGRLRARITFTRDAETRSEESIVAGSDEEVLSTVRRWLDDVRGT